MQTRETIPRERVARTEFAALHGCFLVSHCKSN